MMNDRNAVEILLVEDSPEDLELALRACGIGAVSTRTPFESVCRSNAVTP